MRTPIPLLVSAVLLALPRPVTADVWVDPAVGQPGDGSEAAPLDSIAAALEVIEGGESIWLASGEFGELSISDRHFDSAVVIAGLDGAMPSFSRVRVRDSSGIELRGLHVADEGGDFLIDVSGEDLIVAECVLMSLADSSDWSAQDWIDRASNGIQVGGSGITIRDNRLLNVGWHQRRRQRLPRRGQPDRELLPRRAARLG